jgi:hypothetical protein
LERPDIIDKPNPPVSVISSEKTSASQKQVEFVVDEISVPARNKIVTIPPAPSDHYPDTNGGEDRDPLARERRLKVKEVSPLIFSDIAYYPFLKLHVLNYILCYEDGGIAPCILMLGNRWC